MQQRKDDFLLGLLGVYGASAIKKAEELHPSLGSVIVPRCAVAWVRCFRHTGYAGDIPGIQNTRIVFNKSEKGYEGEIKFQNNASYSFKDVSEYHVAACVVTALGLEEEAVSDVKSIEVARLAKSLDLLVKAHTINEEAEQKAIQRLKLIRDAAKGVTAKLRKKDKDPAGTGSAAKPQAPTPPAAPTAEQPSTMKPIAAVTAPAAKGTSSKPKSTAMKLSEKDIVKVHKDCGTKLFKGEHFVGCICIRDLAKNVKTKKVGTEFFIDLSKLDAEEAITVRESIKNHA